MSKYYIQDDNGTVQGRCTAETTLDLLADPRRRQLVETLETFADSSIGLEKLSQRLSTTSDELDSDTWKIRLHHVHLPALEAHGLADYDTQRQTVQYYGCELISDVLATLEQHKTAR